MKSHSTVRFSILVLAGLIGTARADTIVEGFEGQAPGPNSPAPTWAPAGTGWLVIGALSPLAFASGVTFSSPVPNTEGTNRGTGAILTDYSLGPGDFGLGSNGTVTSASQLPGGTAFLGWDTTASAGSIVFTFATLQSSVGAFVDGVGGEILETAYDIHGNMIGTASVGTGDVSIWPTNFESITAPGIASVSFNGDFEVIDNLTFTNSIPEPASLVLFGSALFAIGFGLRRPRKVQEFDLRHQ